MALRIRDYVLEQRMDGYKYARAEIQIDSADELTTSFRDYVFVQGSIAWDISTGDFYALDSEGTWHKQGGGDDSASDDTQLSQSAAPSLGNSVLSRPSLQPITDTTETVESLTSDSEGITDDSKTEEEIPEEITEVAPEETEETPVEDVPDTDVGETEVQPEDALTQDEESEEITEEGDMR